MLKRCPGNNEFPLGMKINRSFSQQLEDLRVSANSNPRIKDRFTTTIKSKDLTFPKNRTNDIGSTPFISINEIRIKESLTATVSSLNINLELRIYS